MITCSLFTWFIAPPLRSQLPDYQVHLLKTILKGQSRNYSINKIDDVEVDKAMVTRARSSPELANVVREVRLEHAYR
jgi:hypothetical protein